MSVSLDALAAELLEQVRSVVREEVQSCVGVAQQQPEGFLNTKSAAQYLDTTEQSIRTAVRRGKRVPNRRGTRRRARLLFTREQLDAYARGEAA